jgi:hypothetical protein
LPLGGWRRPCRSPRADHLMLIEEKYRHPGDLHDLVDLGQPRDLVLEGETVAGHRSDLPPDPWTADAVGRIPVAVPPAFTPGRGHGPSLSPTVGQPLKLVAVEDLEGAGIELDAAAPPAASVPASSSGRYCRPRRRLACPSWQARTPRARRSCPRPALT